MNLPLLALKSFDPCLQLANSVGEHAKNFLMLRDFHVISIHGHGLELASIEGFYAGPNPVPLQTGHSAVRPPLTMTRPVPLQFEQPAVLTLDMPTSQLGIVEKCSDSFRPKVPRTDNSVKVLTLDSETIAEENPKS